MVINAAGPAFFHPFEQELGRAVAHADALGRGSRSVFLRGGALAGGLIVLCALGMLVFHDQLSAGLFNGQDILVPALLVGVLGIGLEHLTRGAFAGAHAFSRYGLQLGLDGGFRLAGAALLALLGVASVGWWGFVLALTPLLAVLFTSHRLGPAVQPAPPDQSWGQLARAVGVLMIGTALAQFVVNAAPVAASIIAAPGEEARAGVFISVLVLARIPVFVFAAIQAAFLPGLAALVAQDDAAGFRRRLRTVLGAVAGLGLAGLIVFVSIGPWLVTLFYGAAFETSRSDLWPLAAGAGLFMVAAAMAQTLISLRAYTASVVGWVLGSGAFLLALLVPGRLEQRVGLAFLASTAVAAAAAGLALYRRLQRPLTDPDPLASPRLTAP